MTAFVILLNKDTAFQYSESPILMAFASFEATLGSFSNVVLCISVFLFAFATVVCWGYYGKECVYYINKSKAAERAYYMIYIFFIFLGSFISLDFVWELADLAVGVMTLMNLFILANMSDEIKKETAKYYRKRASRRKL
jgi:AGCS family alanine or glycine:cation symporter